MPRPTFVRTTRSFALAVLLLCAAPAPRALGDDPVGERLAGALAGLDAREIPSGTLLDRVLRLSGIERFDGSPDAPAADAATWRQAVDELRRAAIGDSPLPGREALRDREARARRERAVPIGLLLARYERIRPDALVSGALRVAGGVVTRGAGAAFETRRAFVAAALSPRAFRGGDLAFVVRRGDVLGSEAGDLVSLEADFADGRGFREVRLDEPVRVHYRDTGPRELVIRATLAGGERREARAAYAVAALAAPLPDDTLEIAAAVPYLGVAGTGRAYVRLAPGHVAITNPVVVVEGFDLDNSLGWDELYALLNQQGLVETLRGLGYDAVVLDFAEATDPVVRNALVVAELLRQVRAAIAPEQSIALVGASMGGLCSRYALAWMEQMGLPHGTRTWITYDTPHLGAVIPLGIQYWTDFFAGQSADAAFLRDRLNTPAAREMLVHHFTSPPGATALPDPLRAAMLAEFAAAGDWPALARRVAFANGSGAGASQGFAPGAQLIRYEYSDLFVTLRGNVWAVPDQVAGQVFSGRIRILFDDTQRNVTVSGARAYDGAPGGFRATMTQMDTTDVPYGDIVALHPAHCFVPVSSAVAVDVADLFEPLAADPSPLDRTPFEAVHLAPANQEHVTIDAPTAAALVAEIQALSVSAPAPAPAAPGIALATPHPNPFAGRTRVAFRLDRDADVRLRVLGVDGRAVATLAGGRYPAGSHAAAWDGRDDRGGAVAAGLYFVTLEAGGRRAAARVVHLR